MSKAPPKKQKPLTDEELAARLARKKEEAEAEVARAREAQKKIASGKRFGAAIDANNGVIPIRGDNAAAFWSKLRDDD